MASKTGGTTPGKVRMIQNDNMIRFTRPWHIYVRRHVAFRLGKHTYAYAACPNVRFAQLSHMLILGVNQLVRLITTSNNNNNVRQAKAHLSTATQLQDHSLGQHQPSNRPITIMPGINLTDGELRVLQLAWQCFKTMPQVNPPPPSHLSFH